MLQAGIKLEQILEMINGKLLAKGKEHFINISTDSRTIKSGELFIPLVGENFNGHKFIDNTFSNGAEGVIVQKNENYNLIENKTFIEVDNTLKAYQQIANFVRKKINPFVIGITGSSGKTSTKEIAYAFLSQFFETYKSEANFNNEIGVPQTLLQLREEHKIAIIEMGMRGKGQIEELALIAEPNVGIITGIGSAHIELLGSKKDIAEAKWELAKYIENNDGYIIIPAYDKYLLEMSKSFKNSDKLISVDLKENDNCVLTSEKSWIKDNKQYFTYKDNQTNKTYEACLSVHGQHQISNALLVLSLAKILNISYPDFIDLSFENLSGRSEIIKIKQANFINDAYNANPESMKASIKTFIESSDKKKKILVIGEMKELGEHSYREHYEVGEFCSNLDFDQLILIGQNTQAIKDGLKNNPEKISKTILFDNNQQASEYLKKYLDSDIDILLKASRGAKLEEIISYLTN
ncbi:MAG: UDP-N-acetylmuramoyl-tripeptide--D-alanyl-D-alanine ligase [Candidatus Sericytochromatia bacterium]|nr:UDP-N-acetylmuramoyl-tripeptide--D-alanyl-D-alanine ligase [Candidatus Sericytochromatia bacterium]